MLVGGVLGREVRAGENWAYLDVGAYNGLMETQQTVNQWRYPLWSSRADHAAADQVPFTVTGPSCDSSDTTFFGVYLPATLDAGDRLYIGSAGAYTLSYASNFNGFPPPSPVFIGRPMTRLRRLIATALVDSFGLSLGWTVFSLPDHAQPRPGRAGPVQRGHAGRGGAVGPGGGPAQRPPGRAGAAPGDVRDRGRAADRHLRAAARRGAAGRGGGRGRGQQRGRLDGYAGMRAEVAAADPRGSAMTWYMVAVAAIEAAGTATAALLPTGPGGLVSGGLLVAVVAGYGACLLPTWLVAGGALVARAAPLPRAAACVRSSEVAGCCPTARRTACWPSAGW